MTNCDMHKRNIQLYEEPTTYKYDYVHYPLNLTKKIPVVADDLNSSKDAKCSDSLKRTFTAHDTFQRLSYDKRIPFNTLWQSKDAITVSIKPITRHKILEDHWNHEAIRSRPRVYMTPSISLDDIQNSETRKLLLDFTYMTTFNYTSKDVWGDFKSKHPCTTEINIEEISKESTQKPSCSLSARFPNEAKEWDKLQDRSFLLDDIKKLNSVDSNSESKNLEIEQESERLEVKQLLDKDKLRIPYDKLPLTYGGYRPYIGLGIPLEKKVLSSVHPGLSVSQALHHWRSL
ncbi:PREDICTED: uncharacterized protein LOC106793940 [Polistes canadensis]|uniref:uncharacterized protein LOC106793940 n=1 Tax=Polistes canadensis TaxID=91411 RepID=UPI000718BC0F|nr:PREDICTED: uncharacterized protein LOC106793940 [Polistes canadensis]